MNALVEESFELAAKLSPHSVPVDLLATDRILLRWAASIGDGNDDASWQELIKSRVSRLSDDVAIVVDQLVLRSPPSYRKVTELWYRTPEPREAIAVRMQLSRHEVYNRWRISLFHFRRHFEGSPLSALRRLAVPDMPSRLAMVRASLVES